MALTARIRFGATRSSLVPAYTRGETVEVWCDFNDENGALVDVSGVTCVTYWPSGAERTPALTPTEVTAGTWTVEIPALLYDGLWKIVFACTSPSAATASAWFSVRSSEPNEGPAPDPSYTAILEAAVVAQEAAEASADEAAAQVVLAEAQVALASDEADRAEDAADAAASAVSTGTGPLNATSVVAATLDGNGRCTNYTCVLPRTIQTGSVIKIVFPTASGAPGITIRPTVASVLQSFYALRGKRGTQIVDGFFRANIQYSFVYDGTVLRCEGEEVSEEIVRTTGYQRNYYAPGDANPRHRDYPLADGRRLFYTGDGTASPTVRLGIEADGSVRVYGTLTIDDAATVNGAAVMTEGGPPALIADNVKHIVGAPSRMNNRTAPQRTSVASYYQVGGLDQHRDIVVANGAWVDFLHMPKGSTVNLVPSSAGAVFHLYTGEGEWDGDGVTAATLTPHSWVNTGTKILTTSAGAWVRVRRGSGGNFLATCDYGSVSDGTGAVMPTQDVVVGWGPQSWGVDMRQNSAAGWVPRMSDLGLGDVAYFPDTANVGASSLLYFTAKATLSYWNAETDTPTQRLDDMIAAIQADRTARTALMGTTAPAMSVMCWFEGLNLMGYWGPSNTHPYNCPQAYTASMVKAFQYINAQLGYDLTYIVIPLTSQKLGTFAENLWHPVRMAQLRAVAAGAAASPAVNIIIAPEVYGDPRSGDEEAESGERHYDFPVHAVVAGRIADAWANEVDAQTNHLGPIIRASNPVVTADAGAGLVWDVVIDYGDGRAFNSSAGPDLAGFRLLPAGTGNIDTDDWATPLEIASTAWAGAGGAPLIALRVTLAEAYTGGTPRPVVLYGSAAATDDLDTLIYTLHPTTAKRMYLRQFLSGG